MSAADILVPIFCAAVGAVAARFVLVPLIERACADGGYVPESEADAADYEDVADGEVVDEQIYEVVEVYDGPPPGSSVSPKVVLTLEILTGLVSGAVGWRFGMSRFLVTYLVVTALLIALSTVDLYQFRIPDRILFPGLWLTSGTVAVASLTSNTPERFVWALIGAAVYAGVLGMAWFIHPRGMGFGDVKFGLLLGLATGCLNLRLVLVGLGIGCAIGAFVGIGLLLVRRKSMAFPFGPSLAAGAMVAVLAAPYFIERLSPTA